MPRLLSFAICLFIIHYACAQDVNELERRHGFKDLRLGTPIDSVRGAKFKKDLKEKNEYPVKLYAVENPDYMKIGEVKVNSIEVKTYTDLVYEIFVITDKDPRLMKGMETVLGRPQYNAITETYFWTAPSLSLSFKSHSKKELEMVYRYFPVLQKMKDDKDKKIDDIADDF